ncbi:hypothetical protein [[Eubacterium] cellulosolvens]
MPMKLDDLLRDERFPRDENELDNWEQRIYKFFIDNLRLKKAYTETEIFIAMTQKYRNPLPTIETIKSALTELVTKDKVLTKSHENIPYYWVE